MCTVGDALVLSNVWLSLCVFLCAMIKTSHLEYPFLPTIKDIKLSCTKGHGFGNNSQWSPYVMKTTLFCLTNTLVWLGNILRSSWKIEYYIGAKISKFMKSLFLSTHFPWAKTFNVQEFKKYLYQNNLSLIKKCIICSVTQGERLSIYDSLPSKPQRGQGEVICQVLLISNTSGKDPSTLAAKNTTAF